MAQARAAAAAGVLCGFGCGPAVPKRDYSLAELRLNKIEPTVRDTPSAQTNSIVDISHLSQMKRLSDTKLTDSWAPSVSFH